MDEQLKTVYVTDGTTTEITWENTAITGQIQITKTSADYNSMNGWPAGTPIPNTEFEIYNARTGNLVDTIKTDKNGVASSRPLPLGRYKIVESKAADFYGLDQTPIEVEIEYAGQIVKAAMTNKSLYTNVSIKKTGYYQEAGYKVLNRTDDASLQTLVAQMKAEGREKEIQKELKKLKNLKQTSIPKALAYVSGELFEQYIHDMKIVQHFAMLNRQAMIDEIVKGMKLHVEEQFTTIHNYIDTDAMILRKGAVSAKEGEQLLIPINMRDGSLLCVGKGNEDWNCSAPHGAGRLMSRADAKQSFTVSEFKKQMAEVYTTSVSKATLDECPMAYKGMQDILDNIGPTAEVRKIIRPIYNFKAGDED